MSKTENKRLADLERKVAALTKIVKLLAAGYPAELLKELE
jgi:hypothetical protein